MVFHWAVCGPSGAIFFHARGQNDAIVVAVEAARVQVADKLVALQNRYFTKGPTLFDPLRQQCCQTLPKPCHAATATCTAPPPSWIGRKGIEAKAGTVCGARCLCKTDFDVAAELGFSLSARRNSRLISAPNAWDSEALQSAVRDAELIARLEPLGFDCPSRGTALSS
eukprot:s470_g20.t1